MAKLVITSTTNAISVEFNDYSTLLEAEAATYNKKDIRFYRKTDRVVAYVKKEKEWNVSHVTTTGALIIDSVDGVAPVSVLDLYNKLITLL